ncbi:MAG: purine-nucleoside/S-methyl-5-thioadenosine phosphorylase / adenosine deaminase [Thermoleophilaceae bacterium]|nr:purine-nucleoside/S-methyl-5-thioadenosine phosphorylase / adenosine deaminase [Thermoleophilaceae bacterium]
MIDVELPGGRAAFSTRAGGVSEGPYESLNLGVKTGDTTENVVENRRRVAEELGLDPEHVARVWQVHGAELREWSEYPGPPGWTDIGRRLDHADGQLTSLAGLGLGVLVADCLPVALVAPGRAAMLHCGWRPLAAGIVEKALASFDEPPVAAIGPGIGSCCYEVGDEVLAEFADLDGVADGRMLDLRMVAHRRLEAAGVTRIEDVDLCTFCRPDLFFSHRRDKGVTGRQGGFAWLT